MDRDSWLALENIRRYRALLAQPNEGSRATLEALIKREEEKLELLQQAKSQADR